MRICVLTTVHNPDDNRVFHKQVLSLRNLGYEVVYVAPNVTPGVRDGIEYVNYEKPANKFRRMLDFYRVFKMVKGLDCKICHFHDVELIPVGLLLKKKTKIKVIYDVHEDYRNQMMNKYYLSPFFRKLLYRVVAWLENESNKRFDFIITADAGTRRYFDEEKSEVLYNFPKLSDYEDICVDTEKEYDLVFLGSASKFIVDIMLHCTAKLKKQGYNIKTLMVRLLHFTDSYHYVDNRKQELGLTDEEFVLIDRLPTKEIPHFLTKCKIGMIPLENLPKYANNIPTKLFEDMLCGLPVIASDLAPARSFMEGNEVGFLVEHNDVDGYAEKIKLLLEHDELREKMGNNGRRFVIEKCNWENEEKKLREIYRVVGDF